MRSRRLLGPQLGRVLFVALAMLMALPPFVRADTEPSADKEKVGITIESVPSDAPGPKMASDPIKGSASGVSPKDYKIVVYALGGDTWYVQPTAASPLIDIKADSTWESQTHGGTDFVALIVKPSYDPPATIGTLPKIGGDVLARSTKKPEKK